jgi:hypothetical protein
MAVMGEKGKKRHQKIECARVLFYLIAYGLACCPPRRKLAEPHHKTQYHVYMYTRHRELLYACMHVCVYAYACMRVCVCVYAYTYAVFTFSVFRISYSVYLFLTYTYSYSVYFACRKLNLLVVDTNISRVQALRHP